MAMEVTLCSHANVLEVINLVDVIESTQCWSLPNSWRERLHRTLDYHPDTVEESAVFVFYDPWMRRKIDQHAETNRATVTFVAPDELLFGLVHKDRGVERRPFNVSGD